MHANLLHSRTGLAMRAMRDAPAAAAVLGVDMHVLKVKIFVLSAVLGALSGSLFAHYVSFVSVDSFGVDRAINFLLLAVLGGAQIGMGRGAGCLVRHDHAAPAERLRRHPRNAVRRLLIAAVIFLPDGFGGALQRALRPPPGPATRRADRSRLRR